MAALKARVAAAIGGSKAKGGLNVGLHPALDDLAQGPGLTTKQGDTKAPAGRAGSFRNSVEPFKASSKGLQNGAPTSAASTVRRNPYLDSSTAHQGGSGKQRESRQLNFNQKGKYIQQANALRKQAALEALKKRIAEQTRKAGIDEDLDVEKNFVVEQPPDIEWWDEGLVGGSSYGDDDPVNRLKIGTEDSIITEFIQHPVALEPPQDKNTPAAKPMYLTSKEQAKLRRQRRGAELKEEQAKIRLGLVPAPPPKVKKNNMMRVYSEEFVADPSAVELRVNREIADRHQKHLQTNEDRKLSKEQKHEKLAANQEKDAAKGLHIMVFKIGSLANGKNRYKVGVNAEQLALTGITILNPKFNLVIVEGGSWAIEKYRKLMLGRIDWTENAPSRDSGTKRESLRQWLMAEDEAGGLRDLSRNECKLVFEGEVKNRAFRKWGSRVCETDAEAREVLARVRMDNFWAQAKSMP